jgi:hypothetical protein
MARPETTASVVAVGQLGDSQDPVYRSGKADHPVHIGRGALVPDRGTFGPSGPRSGVAQ